MLLSSIVLLYAGDSISSAFNLVTTVAAVLVIFAWAMIMSTAATVVTRLNALEIESPA